MGKAEIYVCFSQLSTLMTEDWDMNVVQGKSWGELCDRKVDPYHLDNKWEDARYAGVLAELTRQLLDHMIGQMDESPRAIRPA